jgi:transketolase
MYKTDKKPVFGEGYTFQYGAMDVMAEGKDGAIITYGGMVYRALKIRESLAAKGVNITVVNMPCVNEIDEKAMTGLVNLPRIITYEDHNHLTGIAPVITAHLLKKGFKGKFESFGATSYGASGDTDEVMQTQGLDVESMTAEILGLLG